MSIGSSLNTGNNDEEEEEKKEKEEEKEDESKLKEMNEKLKHSKEKTNDNDAQGITHLEKMKEQEETYTKRSGVVDEGKQYEYLMCALYALRFCSSDEISDFKMTTNDKTNGNFDDIALNVTFKTGEAVNFFFQLKHRYQAAPITKEMLTNTPVKNGTKKKELNKFYLIPFIEAIDVIKNKQTGNEQNVFIVLTNSKIDISKNEKLIVQEGNVEFDVVEDGYLIADDLIQNVKDENRRGSRFQLVPNNANSDFPLTDFHLLGKQNNVNCLEEDVRSLLNELVGGNCYLSFEQFMRNWWKDNYVLNKHHFITKLAELALNPYISPVSASKHNAKTEYLEKAIMEFEVTLVENDEEDIVKNIWNDSNILDLKLPKIFDTPDNDEIKKSKSLWYYRKVPLIIKVDESNEHMVHKIVALLKKDDQSGNLLLIGSQKIHNFTDVKMFQSLSDFFIFDKAFLSNLLSTFNVSFQGKPPQSLASLKVISNEFFEKFCYNLTTEDLLKMSQEDYFLIGEKIEEIQNHYIPRELAITAANASQILRLTTLQNTVILVSCNDEFKNHFNNRKKINLDDFSTNITHNELSKTFTHGKTIFFVSSTCMSHFFKKICQTFESFNVYFFNQIEEDICALIMRKGRPLTKHVILKTLSENEILNKFCNPINVLCATPGMGKSTMMKALSKNSPLDVWTVNVNLIEYSDFFLKSPDSETILEEFLKTNKTSKSLTSKTIKNFQKLEKVILFLDGLDEIDSEHANQILRFINNVSKQGIRVWLSSRDNLREKICQNLNIVPIKIELIDAAQQSAYIQKKLKNKYTENDIEKIIECVQHSTDIVNSRDLLGIPLQLYILTEMFLNDNRAFKNLNEKNIFVLTHMYKLFFSGKIESCFNKIKLDKHAKDFLGFGGDYVEKIIESYEYLALKCCLDEEDFKQLNILSDNKIKYVNDNFGIIRKRGSKIIFDHQTYAEYFACAYLKKHKDKLIMLKDKMFSERYENLRKILDIMLAENNPLHLAIIYKNKELFDKHFDDNFFEKGCGGRTALHLVCMYGQKYFNDINMYLGDCMGIPLMKYKLRTDNLLKKDDINTYMLSKILSNKIYTNCADRIFQFDAIMYALASKNLFAVQQMLQTKCIFDDIKDVLYKNYSKKLLILLSILLGWHDFLDHLLRDLKKNESFGGPLINYAVLLKDNKKVIDVLIKHGYKIDAKDHNGICAIHLACREGNYKHVKLLLDRGANLETLDNISQNVLHYACESEKENLKLIDFLLDKKVNLNGVNHGQQTPLHLACLKGRLKTVKLLLEKGAKVNILDKEHNNELHYVCSCKEAKEETIDLIQNEVNLNARNEKGQTALHLACYQGHFEIVVLMVKRGADPNILDANKRGALHYACSSEKPNLKIVEWLLSSDFNLNLKNVDGENALHLACYNGHIEIVKLLLSRGIDVNAVDENCKRWKRDQPPTESANNKDRIFNYINFNVCDRHHKRSRTPLQVAFSRRHFEIVKLLIAKGADPNILDSEQENLLHYACDYDEVSVTDIIITLLNNKPEFNAKNKNGQTPLHLACLHQPYEVICLLQEKEPFVFDSENNNPLHYICSRNQEDLQILDQLFNNWKEILNAKNNRGQTALHVACFYGEFEIVNLLIEKGANVNDLDSQNNGVLHYASGSNKHYCKRIIKLLFDNGVNLKTKNKNEQTAKDVAHAQQNFKLLNFLEGLEAGVNANQNF